MLVQGESSTGRQDVNTRSQHSLHQSEVAKWTITAKGRFTTNRPLRSAWQTVLVGGLAASAAFAIAKLIG